MRTSGLEIKVTLRRPAAAWRIPFQKISEAILGSRYELSLVICGDSLAQKMNKLYRKKNYRPNVLSFPIGKADGEIFLNVRCAQREARRFGVGLNERLALLFVHGCFHLKGLSHGRIMEAHERRVLRRFGFSWHGESIQE